MRPHPGFPLREGKLLKPSHLSSQRLKSLAIGRSAVASQPLRRRMERTGKAICKGPSRTAVAAKEAVSECGQRANSPNWARALEGVRSGERTRLACWRLRPRGRELPFIFL